MLRNGLKISMILSWTESGTQKLDQWSMTVICNTMDKPDDGGVLPDGFQLNHIVSHLAGFTHGPSLAPNHYVLATSTSASLWRCTEINSC